MTDQGVTDGSAQRKSEGGVTTKRRWRKQPDRERAAHTAAALDEASQFIDGLRSGSQGEWGQQLVADYFPKGFYTYPAQDQLATTERIRRKVQTRLEKQQPDYTPPTDDTIRRQLWGPEG